MTERFYVYEHVRPDTGEVFYVGKGTLTARKGFSRSSARRDRSRFWLRIITKAGGFEASVVAICATEDLAFRLERGLIALYGRQSDGGSLCNLTLGGEGHAGLPMSQERKLALSARMSGSGHHNWGKKLSAETCRRKSESMKASPKNLRGKRLPQWWKDKISATKCGARNPMFGRTGEKHPNARAVVDVGGTRYPSVTAAARALGYSVQGLHSMLTGFRPNTARVEFA